MNVSEGSSSAALNPHEHGLQTSAKECMEVDSTSNATRNATPSRVDSVGAIFPR